MNNEIKNIPAEELERIQLTAEHVAENNPDLTEMGIGIYIAGYQNGAKAEHSRLISLLRARGSQPKVLPWLKDLIEMAEDGDKLNRSNGVDQEFLQENRETLSAARAYLTAQKSTQPEPAKEPVMYINIPDQQQWQEMSRDEKSSYINPEWKKWCTAQLREIYPSSLE